MKIIFFTHPSFTSHQSMPRFSKMLSEGMKNKGHEVHIWSPKPFFVKLSKINQLKKWLGYIDQYIIFPMAIKKRIKHIDKHVLFVFCDHALGPWVPYVKKRHHVIHCHDFLAQQSALGQIPFNKVGFSGKMYQKLIRNGYSQGQNFISVSNRTKLDLGSFLKKEPFLSEVVYNGLNREFSSEIQGVDILRNELSENFNMDCQQGYILHIGGNQWYKNRKGIIKIYDHWRIHCNNKLPLVLIGENPDDELLNIYKDSCFKEDIVFLSGVSDAYINKFYNAASVFLFPSLAEGFGWPIAEAMASGCLVITTNESPMNEVGSDAAFYIPVMPNHDDFTEFDGWLKEASKVLEKVISLSDAERHAYISKGLRNAERFNQCSALNKIEALYKLILEQKIE
ncbi:glycosyltransferase involved in cell wall biosynthesis [Mariniflexile fucanivorans]|uniref:Glycosyltransferase involved in cell wall biosynthesis n=1 Tax=Mariniflexile fucanivorans TaxID=264023 RepID=A0A4R1RKH0_9FLAO|nr:glycosyltransferase [Mariniflexile fucanivorans]TCL66693.1 glycosyltransferase involved in cell wall biosynthesis [Mariniflexile fucanivorans]